MFSDKGKFTPKGIRECVFVQLELCGLVKKAVVDAQTKYFEETGRHLGKKQAIYKILTEK
jgi:hypothetical protein